jgi:hypothetical protein
MAITGVHALIYTSEPEAVRAVFRDVFGWDHVDAGDDWLIFKLPPAELGVHPSQYEVRRELSLMCDDLEATMADFRAKGIEFEGEPVDEGWGLTINMVLPGNTKLMLYVPRYVPAF